MEQQDYGIFGKNACKGVCSYESSFANINGVAPKDWLFGKNCVENNDFGSGFRAFMAQMEAEDDED